MTTKSTGKWVIFGIAFTVACLIWYMVISNDDPRVTISLGNLPVTLKNGDTLHEKGLAYYVEEAGSIGVTVTVLQTRGWLVSAEDIRLTADISGVEGETAKVSVKAEVVDNQAAIGTNYKLQRNNMVIRTEPLKKKKIPVVIHTEGEPEDNCSVGNCIPEMEYVTIRIPASIEDKVVTAEATVDVSGRSAGFQDEVVLSLMSEKQTVVSCQENQILMDEDPISVFIPIGIVKEVPIVLPGEEQLVKEGYRCSDITVERDTVRVIGSEEQVDKIDTITVSGKDLSEEKVTESFEKVLNLSHYLSGDVMILEKDEESLEINVTVKKMERKNYRFDSSSLKLLHLSDDCEAFVRNPEIVVEIEALGDELEALNPDNIEVTADLSGFSEGVHQIPVEIRLIGTDNEKRYKLIDAGTVKIQIKKKKLQGEE